MSQHKDQHKFTKEEWDYIVNTFTCKDCGFLTFRTAESKHYYMVTNEIWAQHGCGDGMLCIDCLEARVGRTLTAEDFTDCPLNLVTNDYVRKLKENFVMSK